MSSSHCQIIIGIGCHISIGWLLVLAHPYQHKCSYIVLVLILELVLVLVPIPTSISMRRKHYSKVLYIEGDRAIGSNYTINFTVETFYYRCSVRLLLEVREYTCRRKRRKQGSLSADMWRIESVDSTDYAQDVSKSTCCSYVVNGLFFLPWLVVHWRPLLPLLLYK